MRSDIQIEKLVPQPQLATAFGFLIWKDWPSRLSTKSISEPAMTDDDAPDTAKTVDHKADETK